jgi:hypothetical protein
MSVVIPIKYNDGVHAIIKPENQECPHLKYELDDKFECVIHETPEYIGSPCWVYKSNIDPNYKLEQDKPCPVGLNWRNNRKHFMPIGLSLKLNDLGLWDRDRWSRII